MLSVSSDLLEKIEDVLTRVSDVDLVEPNFDVDNKTLYDVIEARSGISSSLAPF